MEQPYSEDQLKHVIQTVRTAINNETISPLNIMSAVLSAMITAGHFAILPGAGKKKLVLRAVATIIDESGLPDADKISLKLILNVVLDSAIDVIVDASKGEYSFNRVVKTGCFGLCK